MLSIAVWSRGGEGGGEKKKEKEKNKNMAT